MFLIILAIISITAGVFRFRKIMNKKSYRSVDELKLDLKKMNDNPNDEQLFLSVLNRFENSKPQIQSIMLDELQDATLLVNPYMVFGKALRDNPKTHLVIKAKQDPWFNC